MTDTTTKDTNERRQSLLHALVGSAAGVKNGFTYVLAPQGVKPGDSITSGPTSAIHPGNTLPLSAMPIGQQVPVLPSILFTEPQMQAEMQTDGQGE